MYNYTIGARVKIQGTSAEFNLSGPGLGTITTPQPGQSFTWDSAGDRRAGIQSIEVVNSIKSPFGRFSITLTPSQHLGSADERPSLAEIFEPYSLVAISLHRYGQQPGNTARLVSTDEPEPIMLGVLDNLQISEDFSAARPQRRVTLSGRSLSAVLADHRWYFHNWLQTQTGADFIPDDFRKYYSQLPDEAQLFDETALRDAKLKALAPELLFLPAIHPSDVMTLLFRAFVTGSFREKVANAKELFRRPFIQLQFADGSVLSDRLKFDSIVALDSYFDPRAKMNAERITPSLENTSCFGMMNYFSPRFLNELWSDTVGDTIDNCFVQIISRKPPWQGFMGYSGPGGEASVDFPNGKPPKMRGQSLFDDVKPSGAEGPPVMTGSGTVVIDINDVLSRSISKGGVEGVDGAYTVYAVRPEFAGAQTNSSAPANQQIPPIYDVQRDSPGFIFRYGFKPLDMMLQGVPFFTDDSNAIVPQNIYNRRCGAVQALLYEWFHRAPGMWRGSMTLMGRTGFRAGKRLLDLGNGLRPPREYYITGVRHRMTFGPQAPPLYTTTVDVDRGWDLDG